MRSELPSKTFLIGEYSVLNNGAALVLNTSPYFKYEKNQLKDPHRGRGGFGASSSEWLFNYSLSHTLPSEPTVEDAKEAIQNYRDEMWDGKGLAPSGVDIVAQWTGGVALVDIKGKRIESLKWPFPKLSFVIVRTGKKVRTHEHLRDLSRDSLSELSELSQKGVESFLSQDTEAFIASINRFDKALEKNELCCESTLKIKSSIRESGLALAVKGCGALGADTVLVISRLKDRSKLIEQIAGFGLEIVATEEDLDHWRDS